MTNKTISIVVPALNEEDNIAALFERIDCSMDGVTYEIVLVDDHSTDLTVPLAESLSSRYPIHVIHKQGQPGKAQALLEGFAAAQYDVLCMIDADLQYPPEAIGPMLSLLHDKNADVIVTEREENETSLLRKVTSRGFNFIFARLLFGISYDTQSGLKVFRKAVLNDFDMKPSPWSFDLEFLVRSLENKRKILNYTIPFSTRNAGATKVKVVHVAYELAKASIGLRWRTSITKVRAGHKQNSNFIRKAFPTSLVLLISLIGAFTLLPVRTTEAAPLTDIGQLTDGIVSSLPVVGDVLPDISSGQPDIQSAGNPVSNPTISQSVTSAPSSTSTTATMIAETGSVSSSRQASAVSVSTAATRTTAIILDRSGLTAATGNTNESTYQTAAYTPSSQTRRRISIAATAALTAGLVCLVTVLAISVSKVIAKRHLSDKHWATR